MKKNTIRNYPKISVSARNGRPAYGREHLRAFFIQGGGAMKGTQGGASSSKASSAGKDRRKLIASEKKIRAKQNREMAKMEFDDFKKAVIARMDGNEVVFFEFFTWNNEQHDTITNGLLKEIRAIKKNLETAEHNFRVTNERLHALEGFTTCLGIAYRDSIGKPMTLKEKDDLASMLSIDMEATRKNYFGTDVHANA
jgi:hypothetical protein